MGTSTNIASFLRGTEQAKARQQAAAGRALGKFAAQVISRSMYWCPKQTGALAASGMVGELSLAGGAMAVTVGHNMEYAAAVHERLGATHKPPTRAKYLSTAIRELTPKLRPFVAAEMEKAL